jgi:hypothetical protein
VGEVVNFGCEDGRRQTIIKLRNQVRKIGIERIRIHRFSLYMLESSCYVFQKPVQGTTLIVPIRLKTIGLLALADRRIESSKPQFYF